MADIHKTIVTYNSLFPKVSQLIDGNVLLLSTDNNQQESSIFKVEKNVKNIYLNSTINVGYSESVELVQFVSKYTDE